MRITDVRVRKISKEGKMKAVVSITLDDEFVVHDIKVIEGEKGMFIAMPSKKASDGEYRDIAHPINSGTRDYIQKEILDAFDDLIDWYRQRGLYDAYHNELCTLAIMHVYLAAAVRVARADPHHPLLERLQAYMTRTFPDFLQNPYIPTLPRSHRLLIRLLRRRQYTVIYRLFRIKDKL